MHGMSTLRPEEMDELDAADRVFGGKHEASGKIIVRRS